MSNLYDVWFTKEELEQLDEALHILKNQDPFLVSSHLMSKLDHLIERANEQNK